MVDIRNTRLFLDMDGVFCDFEKGAQKIIGNKYTRNVNDKELWPVLMATPFFESLDMMPGADQLWTSVRAFLERSGQRIPIFLTGCPKPPFRERAEKGKEEWVRRHFLQEGGTIHVISVPLDATFEEDGAKLNGHLETLLAAAGPQDIIMIFCKPDQKQIFSTGEGEKVAMLLDDRAKAGPEWEKRPPGLFLHHLSAPANGTNGRDEATRDALSRTAVAKSVAALNAMRGGGARGARKTHRRRQHGKTKKQQRK